ncbi:MAG: cysteine desulfurase [Chloroflexi bacterium]|nr:cysteine desulfurase [Chloroflexota bacterium]
MIGESRRDRTNAISTSDAFDAAAIRRDFPILAREVHGKPLVYLDNAATSQKPRQVIQALVDYYERYNANIHRGVHALAEEATDAYEGARRKVGRFIGSDGPDEIVLTRNTTESLNLVAYAWARDNVRAGDEIVITAMEHHSNIVPWQWIARDNGATLKWIDFGPDGTIDLADVDRLVTPRTKLVAMTHMSNVLGTINPVREAAKIAHARGALMLVDGAQSVPHLPVDVADLDCDFLAFSSHKMLGPTGVGVLWGRRAILENMRPFLGGGEMIEYVSRENTTYNTLPWKYEAGTPNIADVIAFGAAVDYLGALGMDRVREHEIDITRYALERIATLPNVTLYGPMDPARRGGVVSFTLGSIHPHDLGQIVDYEGVAIRVGAHCCQPLMNALDLPGTARASFYVYNTFEEVDLLERSLWRALEVFGEVEPDPARSAQAGPCLQPDRATSA